MAMAGVDAYAAIAELLHKSQVSHYTTGASHSRPTQQLLVEQCRHIRDVFKTQGPHPVACLCDAGRLA